MTYDPLADLWAKAWDRRPDDPTYGRAKPAGMDQGLHDLLQTMARTRAEIRDTAG